MAKRGKAAGGPKNWSDLSPATRSRLTSAGITRQAWYRGDSLNAAYGHKVRYREPAQRRARGEAPRGPMEREIAGEAIAGDLQALQSWAESKARPSWIPDNMSAPTAAALSQIPGNPKSWGSVHFTPVADDQPWEMIVTPRGHERGDGHDIEIEIPGGGGRHTWGAREVLDWLTYPDDDTFADQFDWDIGYE